MQGAAFTFKPGLPGQEEKCPVGFLGLCSTLDLGDRCSSIALLQGNVSEVESCLCVLLLLLRAGLSSPNTGAGTRNLLSGDLP